MKQVLNECSLAKVCLTIVEYLTSRLLRRKSRTVKIYSLFIFVHIIYCYYYYHYQRVYHLIIFYYNLLVQLQQSRSTYSKVPITSQDM
jgi:hypothetical protein